MRDYTQASERESVKPTYSGCGYGLKNRWKEMLDPRPDILDDDLYEYINIFTENIE